jgi:hypothetical protein
MIIRRITIALGICALAASVTLGKTRKDSVTFTQDLNVNGTLVKSGSYEVSFNDETNELAIIKRGKVVAKTTAKASQRDGKANATEVKTITTSAGVELIGVAFGGSDKNILVDRGGEAARK